MIYFGQELGEHGMDTEGFSGRTDGDALTAVDQQVGEAAGQDAWLFLRLVEVGVPVDGVLVDVGQHLHRHAAHAGLGVTVSSRGVAIDRAEVTLTIHQRVLWIQLLVSKHQGNER